MNNLDVSKTRRWARVQLLLTVLFALFAILAIGIPMWIETVIGVSPDGGNGELELVLAIPFGFASLALGALTWQTRRRLQRVAGPN
jgi:hypothetical protein